MLPAVDPAAISAVLVVLAVAVALGFAVLRYRRKLPRWLRSVVARKRLDVIRRDLDGLAEHIGRPLESEDAVWQPFELGLAAMAGYEWNRAIGHFKRSLAMADGVPLAQIPNQIGVCYYIQGRLAEALREFEECAVAAEQNGDEQGRAAALGNSGVVIYCYGDLDGALKRLREALNVARTSGSQAAVALYLGNIGNVLHTRGEHKDALKAHEEALAVSRRIGDEQGIVRSLGGIASLLYDDGEPDRALERYGEAQSMASRTGYKLGAAVVLSNIGCLYRDRSELDRALSYFEQSLGLAREAGYMPGTAVALGNIGLTFVSKRMYERAVLYLAQSLEFFLAAGIAHGPRQDLYGLSRCDDLLGRERMRDLLRGAGLAEEAVADTLARIDQLRSRRPWQTDRRSNPFAPVGR